MAAPANNASHCEPGTATAGDPASTLEDRMAALESRLAEAEDRLALMQLVASYGPAVDSGSPGCSWRR